MTQINFLKENTDIEQLHNAMRNTYQFEDIDMIKHGEMVYEQYQKLMDAIEHKNEQYFKDIGFTFDWEFIEKLYQNQYDLDNMESYQIYHDCGKHLSKTIDENGKIHYPNHAQHSSDLYGKYFDNKIAQDLILKDLNFHTFKSEEMAKWLETENKQTLASLYLTAWAEILANSSMFGGIESESFKIKRKRLIQHGKKLKESLK